MSPRPTEPPSPKYFLIHRPATYVTHVEINRPDKLNAFFDDMWWELQGIFEYLSTDPETRVIVISGAGEKAFTAGLDVSKAATGDLSRTDFPDAARRATFLRRHIHGIQSTVTAVADCEKPTICLIHGFAFGLGIDLSTACDIRLCSADAQFSVKEVDVGLAADVGTLSRLPKTIGMTSFAKEIALSARVFGAEEAAKNNFVSRVVEGGKKGLIEEGLRLAVLIAGKSPVAVQGTKNIMDQAWGRTVEENLNYTAVWNAGMLQSGDTIPAMMAVLKKKTPTFEKL